jgi:hypothetical protein
MKKTEYWKGTVTFTKQEHKKEFRVLSWLAKAASRDETRYLITGMFNELIDGNRIFVTTDGRRLHLAEFHGDPQAFAGIPAGKNLAFKADAKQITFTAETDRDFPNYKRVIPGIEGVVPFCINVSKQLGYTEALYEFYSRNLRANALHVAGLDGTGDPDWNVYPVGGTVVCKQCTIEAMYTAVFAMLRE